MMATAKLRTSMIQVAPRPVTRYTMRLGLTGHAHFSSASLLPHSAPQCTSPSTEPQLLVTTAMLLDFRLTYQRLPVQSA